MENREKRNRGSNWNHAQTVALAELKRVNEEHSRLVWEQIAQNLSSRFPDQIRTGDQCRRRWDTLVKVYNDIENFCVEIGAQDHRELDEGELASMKLATAYHQDWYDIVEQVCSQVSQRKKKERCDDDPMPGKRSKSSQSVEQPEHPPNRDSLCSASTSKSVTYHELSTPESTTTYAQVSDSSPSLEADKLSPEEEAPRLNNGNAGLMLEQSATACAQVPDSSPSSEADKLSPEEEVPRLNHGNDGLMLAQSTIAYAQVSSSPSFVHEARQLRQHGQVSREVSQELQTLESANLPPQPLAAEIGSQLEEPLQTLAAENGAQLDEPLQDPLIRTFDHVLFVRPFVQDWYVRIPLRMDIDWQSLYWNFEPVGFEPEPEELEDDLWDPARDSSLWTFAAERNWPETNDDDSTIPTLHRLRSTSLSISKKKPWMRALMPGNSLIAKSDILMWLQTTDLAKHMRDPASNAMPQDVAIDVMLQLSKAMWRLNNFNVAHRGLKPSNVPVKPVSPQEVRELASRGYVRVKLSDFGLVKTKAMSIANSTVSKNVGTKIYRAPEVFTKVSPFLKESPKFPRLADWWSFGITLNEILSGQPPFEVEPDQPHGMVELHTKIQKGLRLQLRASCPDYLKFRIQNCSELRPQDRPSFADLWKLMRIAQFRSLGIIREDHDLFTFTNRERVVKRLQHKLKQLAPSKDPKSSSFWLLMFFRITFLFARNWVRICTAMSNAASSTNPTNATRGDSSSPKDTERISKQAALHKKEEESMPSEAETEAAANELQQTRACGQMVRKVEQETQIPGVSWAILAHKFAWLQPV